MTLSVGPQQSPRLKHRRPEEKVAILLLALGNPLGPKLLQSFEPDDVKAIMNSASTLGPVDRDDLDGLVDDFAANFAKALGLGLDFQSVRNLIEQAFPAEQLDTMLKESVIEPQEPVWRRFAAGSENTIVPYLLDEHPQTAAYVVANLDADLAARCLAMMPRELRDTIARRLLKLQPVRARAADLVQSCIADDLLSRNDVALAEEGRRRMANIMNRLDRNHSAAIIDSLAAISPQEARQLKGLVFAFEDIERLPQATRLTLFDKVPTEQVIPALRGMPAEFKECVLSAMGARARRMVEAELAGDAGGEPTKEAIAARRVIADLALTMSSRGEIALAMAE